jgi:hypothetical protein
MGYHGSACFIMCYHLASVYSDRKKKSQDGVLVIGWWAVRSSRQHAGYSERKERWRINQWIYHSRCRGARARASGWLIVKWHTRTGAAILLFYCTHLEVGAQRTTTATRAAKAWQLAIGNWQAKPPPPLKLADNGLSNVYTKGNTCTFAPKKASPFIKSKSVFRPGSLTYAIPTKAEHVTNCPHLPLPPPPLQPIPLMAPPPDPVPPPWHSAG